MDRIIDQGEDYKSYRNLPPIAGLCSFPEAITEGLPVEQCVRRLKRFHYVLRRLHQTFYKHVTAEPIYEMKMAFSYHAYLCAEHIEALRTRVGEMRQPPLGLEKIPHPSLELLFDEIIAAPLEERLLAVYELVVPALAESARRYRRETHPLADQPSSRLCRLLLVELEDLITFGEQSIRSLVDEEKRTTSAAWLEGLEGLLGSAGGLDGADLEPEVPAEFDPQFSKVPYAYEPVPARDERFIDSYNQGVNAETFLYDPAFSDRDKVLM
ncbi:MAG: hypothetical protein AAF514_08140, partial [Verrucomicrobiota bacterium]